MPASHRHSKKSRLDASFARAEETIRASDWDASLQSDLAKYLCVLLSGYAEVCVEDILRDYASTKGDARLRRQVGHTLDRFNNPKPGQINALLATFDAEWAAKLDDFFLSRQECRDALSSVVDHKNKIAHGDDSQVSFHTLKSEWLPTVIETMQFIETMCAS